MGRAVKVVKEVSKEEEEEEITAENGEKEPPVGLRMLEEKKKIEKREREKID